VARIVRRKGPSGPQPAPDGERVMAADMTTPTRTVLERFPAGGPRGSWPAEAFASRPAP
jgi:hypothetical protein